MASVCVEEAAARPSLLTSRQWAASGWMRWRSDRAATCAAALRVGAWAAQALLRPWRFSAASQENQPCCCLPLQEPEFFTDGCGHDPLACPADKQREYVLEVREKNAALLFLHWWSTDRHSAGQGFTGFPPQRAGCSSALLASPDPNRSAPASSPM